MTQDSSRGSPGSGFVVSLVRYPNLFRAPIRISMSFEHNPKLVSFRIMFVVNVELSRGTMIEIEVSGFVVLISILLWFGFCEICGFVNFWVCLNVWVLCID